MFLPTQPSEKQTLTTAISVGVHQWCHAHPNEWDSAPCSFRLPLLGSWVGTGPGSSSKFPLRLGERRQPVPAGGWSLGREHRQGSKAVTLDAGRTDIEWVSSDVVWLLADDLVLSLGNPWNKSQSGAPGAAASPGELSLPSPPIRPWRKGAFPCLLKKAVLTMRLPPGSRRAPRSWWGEGERGQVAESSDCWCPCTLWHL